MKGIIILLVIVYAAVGRAQLDECPKEQETNWEIEWLLRHEDCEKFYKCTFGKPVEMSCPDKLWFNLETWRCDWPHNVDCEDRLRLALGRRMPSFVQQALDIQTVTEIIITDDHNN
ncbi:hypothetical protein HW555_009873 [Spodoptera exigua]|uniref:Chitin-binding type-2 domain-containing protein n=1 Tax=Spodoptera exigua TaxID=7107 RepID=A0A835G9U6_SPOEX|nr:hypothetical protein HW555_009873 [Spodoptera exigua]